jgi:hypothetical protein
MNSVPMNAVVEAKTHTRDDGSIIKTLDGLTGRYAMSCIYRLKQAKI